MERKFTKEEEQNIKLAKKATPSVLDAVGKLVGVAVKELITPVSKALTVYGCRNQLAIIEAVRITQPLFTEIADKYFQVLYETMEISERIDSKNFDIILNAIFADENADIEAKVSLASEVITKQKEVNRENTVEILKTGGKCVLGTVVVAGATVASISYLGYKKVAVLEKGKTDRTDAIMKGLAQVVHEMNPVNSITDCITKISDNKVKVKEFSISTNIK